MSRNKRAAMQARQAYDNILTSLVQSSKLTPEGRNWLITALDPYHDDAYRATGYPDIETARTIVQTVNKKITISAPANASDSPYDCHIAFLPTVLGGSAGNIGSADNGQYLLTTGGFLTSPTLTADCQQLLGGLTICTAPEGEPTWDSGSSITDAVTGYNLSYDEFITGRCRVVGVAFEVHNTTAELYKQGAVVCYRMPQCATYQNFILAGSANSQDIPAYYSRQPPSTIAEALLLTGSVEWDAAAGAYVIPTLNDISNPLTQPTNVPILYGSGSLQAQLGANFVLAESISVKALPATNTNPGLQWANYDMICPYNLSGAYFTGLSPQTVLTVDFRVTIECAPTFDDPKLAVLAQPSPCHDPMALKIYSYAMCKLPAGVPVDENPLGEWFGRVLRAISTAAPVVGDFVGNFFGPAKAIGNIVGKAAGVGADIYDTISASQPQGLSNGNASNMVTSNGNGSVVRPQNVNKQRKVVVARTVQKTQQKAAARRLAARKTR